MTNAGQKRPDRPSIVLTRMDRQKLLKLLQDLPMSSVDTDCSLREEIDRADMISDTATWSSAVRLGCEVKFVELGTSQLRRGRLVLPDDARTAHCISVLSPIGAALIGLGPGQSIRWTERGRERSLAVLEVRASRVSQPT
ncbi:MULTISPECIES: GreA/GreB family elongation factor [unclassified Bradyrhizobium]|uniref:GreA/GreB family elongation factor n=1 Tax=unclassified Bradyrhizobium TaxID=2631580 RepID=UPI003512A66B